MVSPHWRESIGRLAGAATRSGRKGCNRKRDRDQAVPRLAPGRAGKADIKVEHRDHVEKKANHGCFEKSGTSPARAWLVRRPPYIDGALHIRVDRHDHCLCANAARGRRRYSSNTGERGGTVNICGVSLTIDHGRDGLRCWGRPGPQIGADDGVAGLERPTSGRVAVASEFGRAHEDRLARLRRRHRHQSFSRSPDSRPWRRWKAIAIRSIVASQRLCRSRAP